MLNFIRKTLAGSLRSAASEPKASSFTLEALEGRQLLSVVPQATFTHLNSIQVAQFANMQYSAASQQNILLSAAPTAVQNGLQALVSGTTLSASQQLRVRTLADGRTAYGTALAINGQIVRIAVDSNGNPLAGTTTFTNVPAAAQTELHALSSGVTIDAGQQVQIKTLQSGTTIYVVSLAINGQLTRIAADSSGNAIQGTINFSAAPAPVQTALQTQATGITIDPTQQVRIRTLKTGTTVYFTTLTVNGAQTTLATDSTGATVTPPAAHHDPNQTTIDFSTAPTAVQTGLQALAAGVTIPANQQVEVETEDSTTYSTRVTVNARQTTVTVDATGKALAGLIQFGNAPSAVQSGLAALATGITLSSTQLVQIQTRHNGATYSTAVTVNLNGRATQISVDSTGAAVTQDRGHDDGFERGGLWHGGFGGFGRR